MNRHVRKTISVVLATYNEEKKLSACLESIKDLADEIVTVDGTSVDATVKLRKIWSESKDYYK